MGFVEEIEEAARRLRTGDDWYVTEQPYILQLQTSALNTKGIPPTGVLMVLPLGPEEYKVSRVFRQSVTPTLGGIVAEEQGLLWREISIAGTFGLLPKSGADRLGIATADTTLGPDFPFPLASEKLSGPAWTRRMVRNIFETYAELKTDPNVAAETKLIWHDIKTGDSWICVPNQIDIERTLARRMQYPWMISFKAIANADAVIIPPSPASLLDKITNAIATVSKGLTLVSSAIQEGSATLGEVRYYVATIDSVIDKLTAIVDSTSDFVQGITDTISIGATFVSSTAELMESMLSLMEETTELPQEVRQNYQLALDGVHAIGSQYAAFGSTYDKETEAVRRAEEGAAGDDLDTLEAAREAGPAENLNDFEANRERSTDLDLVEAGTLAGSRTLGAYAGTISYVIRSGDTLQSIAAKFLGDGSRWWDLAVFNSLNAPYISEAGAPDTVSVGDRIAVPIERPTSGMAIAKPDEENIGRDKLGTDIALVETPVSRPGRPEVDIKIDQRTYQDVAIISGTNNLAQALQTRLWTGNGTMPLLPSYGLEQAIGAKSTPVFIGLLQLAIRKEIQQDRRVQSIQSIGISVAADSIEFDITVVPAGIDSTQTITLAVI